MIDGANMRLPCLNKSKEPNAVIRSVSPHLVAMLRARIWMETI